MYTNIKGYSVKELPRAARRKWSNMKEGWSYEGADPSENVIFNEFQQTQYDRIREIKEEIKERTRRFSDFRERAKRRAGQRGIQSLHGGSARSKRRLNYSPTEFSRGRFRLREFQ